MPLALSSFKISKNDCKEPKMAPARNKELCSRIQIFTFVQELTVNRHEWGRGECQRNGNRNYDSDVLGR